MFAPSPHRRKQANALTPDCRIPCNAIVRACCSSSSIYDSRLGAAFPSVSAELLGQPDDDAFRATRGAEPVAVLVLRDLADELATAATQAGNDVVMSST
jgi:hypothetical protein